MARLRPPFTSQSHHSFSYNNHRYSFVSAFRVSIQSSLSLSICTSCIADLSVSYDSPPDTSDGSNHPLQHHRHQFKQVANHQPHTTGCIECSFSEWLTRHKSSDRQAPPPRVPRSRPTVILDLGHPIQCQPRRPKHASNRQPPIQYRRCCFLEQLGRREFSDRPITSVHVSSSCPTIRLGPVDFAQCYTIYIASSR